MNVRELLYPMSAIRAFEAVARFRSISAAADDLGVTQPAISQHVRKLEEHLGVRLVERVSTGIRLSEGGEKLAVHLHSAFGMMRNGLEEAISQGQVTLAVLNSFAQRWLIPRLADLQERHPDIDLRLVTRSRFEDLDKGSFDLVVAPRLLGKNLKNSQLLMSDEAWIVMAPSLQKRNPIKVASDISKHVLIKVEENPRDQDWPKWSSAAGMVGLKPLGWKVFSNSSHALEAAVAGVGVAIGHRPMVVDAMQSGRLICPLDVKINEGIGNYIIEASSANSNQQIGLVKKWMMSQVEL